MEISISQRNFEPVQIDPVIRKIIVHECIVKNRTDKPLKIKGKSDSMISKSFSTRKVSINQVLKILKGSGISVNEDEAVFILDFLYMLTNSFKKDESVDKVLYGNVKETSPPHRLQNLKTPNFFNFGVFCFI